MKPISHLIIKTITFIFILSLHFGVRGQIKLDTVFIAGSKFENIQVNVMDSILLIKRVNSTSKVFGDSLCIFVNEKLDTVLDSDFFLNPVIHKTTVYFSPNRLKTPYGKSKYQHIYKWSPNNGVELDTIWFDYDNGLNHKFRIIEDFQDFNNSRIDTFNPYSGASKTIFRINDLGLNKPPIYDWIIDQVFFINDNSFIVEIVLACPDTGGGIEYFYYFINKGVIHRNIEEKFNVKNRKRAFYNNGIYVDGNRGFLALKVQSEGTETCKLYNSNLVFLSNILCRNNTAGHIVKNGNLYGYFLYSKIDNDYEAIVPYVLNPTLELAMYKAYHDDILTNQDIQGLNKKDLGILRNLLFAKHNYKFNSEFYQAYFNLFAFYNGDDKMKSRTKDVNHLLTEADKANITLIRAAEERANG